MTVPCPSGTRTTARTYSVHLHLHLHPHPCASQPHAQRWHQRFHWQSRSLSMQSLLHLCLAARQARATRRVSRVTLHLSPPLSLRVNPHGNWTRLAAAYRSPLERNAHLCQCMFLEVCMHPLLPLGMWIVWQAPVSYWPNLTAERHRVAPVVWKHDPAVISQDAERKMGLYLQI